MTKLVSMLILLALFLPHSTHAAYIMYGQTFETFEELVSYTREYMRIRNELYDTSNTTSPVPIGTTSTPALSQPNDTSNAASKTRPILVSTGLAQNIGTIQTRLVGKVSTKASIHAVRVWFEYGTNPYALTMRTPEEVLYQDRSIRTFDSELRTLTHNTTYYFRAVGITDTGDISYGSSHSFRTAVDPSKNTAAVRIRTNSASYIDDDTATLNASIDFRKSLYARVWFEYGDEENSLTTQTPITVITPTGGRYYTRTLSRLEDETKYFFRAMAEDPTDALSYGKIYSFTTHEDTEDQEPEIRISRMTGITMHEATFSCTVNMNDFDDGTVFFVYGENQNDIRAVSERYSSFKSITERGDDLQKVQLDTDVGRQHTYEEKLLYLDLDTTYYVACGVGYENAENERVLLMTRPTYFTTEEEE